MRIFLSYLHYVALAIGLSTILLRGIRLKEGGPLAKIFAADNGWGVAALLWIATGSFRAFAGYEKGTAYYLHNHWFMAKIGLFGLLFVLELWPMITFLRWRMHKKKTLEAADQPLLQRLYLVNQIEVLLVLLIPLFAVLMAREGSL